MSECLSIDPLITPYIDGDIGAAERRVVDEHVRACAPCHSRVSAERAVRELVHEKRTTLRSEIASPALHDRCAALSQIRGAAPGIHPAATAGWRARVAPLALAASLVVIVGATVVYVSTERSTRLLAAELTADHVKCFGVMNTLLGTSANAAAIEGAMASAFGWQMHVPGSVEAAGLELVGGRPCLYARGRMAHLMYRHNGHPVSVFMIPNMTRPGMAAIKDEVLDVMGHEATVWSAGGRTFVVVAREPQADVARTVAFVRAALK